MPFQLNQQGESRQILARSNSSPDLDKTSRQRVWKPAVVLATCILFGIDMPVVAQELDEEALAKQAQNPVANIISIPIEYWSYDADEGDVDLLIAKPLIPTSLGKFNLINRFIVSYASIAGDIDVEMPMLGGARNSGTTVSGLTDITYQGMLSPVSPGKVIWGVGGAVTFPTASEEALGSNRFSAGPTVLVLVMPGKWVVGLLAQNVWDFAGSGDASVNTFTFQPIINYNIKNGWYLFSSPIWTANWEREEKWTIPIGGGVGKMHAFGKLPVDFKLGYYDNVKSPERSPGSSWLFAVKFLLPKGK